MHPILDKVMNGSEYDRLPEGIKMNITEREYLFMTDGQKAMLVQSETEPETEL